MSPTSYQTAPPRAIVTVVFEPLSCREKLLYAWLALLSRIILSFGNLILLEEILFLFLFFFTQLQTKFAQLLVAYL